MSYFDQVDEAASFLRGRLGEIPSLLSFDFRLPALFFFNLGIVVTGLHTTFVITSLRLERVEERFQVLTDVLFRF